MKKIFGLLAIVFTMTLVALGHIHAAETKVVTQTRPNVLLIITDDQGYGDFSIHGNPHLQTPNIDGLARSSVQFERFYVNSFCAPTRAALLTGRWPLRTGCHGVTHNREAMKPSEITIAEALQSAGYRTTYVGKWHNGEQYPFIPTGQGFDESFGFNNGHWNNYFDATLLRSTKPEDTDGYISDVLTNEALRFIADNKDAPFFCYLSYNAPHSPYQVPDKYFDKYQQKGFDEQVSAFYGMCENIDDNVGRLLAKLDALKIAENTIVLFLTDNGGTAGVKLYNAGMRGGKTSVHEGGSRVPLIMRWPAANWSPRVVKPIASHIDIYPTLLDLCGVTPPNGPKIDGVSLRPLLEKESPEWPERVLFTHNPIDETNRYPGAVRTQTHRLVREIKGPAGGSSAKARDETATAWQLYDMVADPSQKNNIAEKNQKLVNELRLLYDEWFDDISKDGLQRYPLPVGYAEHNPAELHAPQAFFDEPLQFANGPGYAHEWLTQWTDAEATVWFEIDVVREGIYDMELSIACPEPDAGSKLEITVANQTLQITVPSCPPVEVELPHRDEQGKTKYRNREWATLRAGSVKLPQGRTRLTLQPLSMAGSQIMDFKQVKLKLQAADPQASE